MFRISTDFKIATMRKVITWLMGGDAFNMVTQLVSGLMDSSKSNENKRKEVKEKVAPYVNEIGKFVLNSAIAFAVDSLKKSLLKEKK